MRLQAWRNTVTGSTDHPHVRLSIGPIGPGQGVVPWVLPLEAARELWGPAVDTITEKPVEVSLTLQLKGG